MSMITAATRDTLNEIHLPTASCRAAPEPVFEKSKGTSIYATRTIMKHR